MPCDTLPEILGDNVSAKHNDILFEHLLYPYSHNTSEYTLWQATGNSQVKRMNILRNRLSNLIKRFKDYNLRPDNNIIENIVKQLNQKFKKVIGFEFYEMFAILLKF